MIRHLVIDINEREREGGRERWLKQTTIEECLIYPVCEKCLKMHKMIKSNVNV